MKLEFYLKSFTLVEVMLAVVIITIIGAMAIPNLLRTRVYAHEGSASAALRTIASVQTQYRATNPVYATLVQLGATTPAYIDSVLASGSRQDYNFISVPNGGANFYAAATPEVLAQARTFYIDEDGILCRSNATGTATPAVHNGVGCPAGFSELQ